MEFIKTDLGHNGGATSLQSNEKMNGIIVNENTIFVPTRYKSNENNVSRRNTLELLWKCNIADSNNNDIEIISSIVYKIEEDEIPPTKNQLLEIIEESCLKFNTQYKEESVTRNSVYEPLLATNYTNPELLRRLKLSLCWKQGQ